jgi:hypothetical protein
MCVKKVALELSPPPFPPISCPQRALDAIYPGEKRQESENDHSLAFSAKVKNAVATPLLPYVFMV